MVRKKKKKPRQANALATTFAQRLRTLERTRVKAESLFIAGEFSKRDVGYIYEAIFLTLMTRFESLLEELFFALLMGRIVSTHPGTRSKIEGRSEVVIRGIVHGGDHYLKWLPYKETSTRAQYYLARGLPFSLLDDADRSFLTQCMIIRNALAHKSRFAMGQFHDKVGGVSGLPPRERTPAGFLRAEFRAAPVQRRYENFAARMAVIATKLCR
jgi:hypothetical protein